MRIITGKYKGRTIRSSKGVVTRPIPDRIKESLFQQLEPELQDARVADIFAGTGTLGLESLSRGARSAVFIEQDPQAHELLKANTQAFGVTDHTLCWKADVNRCSFRPKNASDLTPWDVVFFDPPYRFVPDIVPRTPLYRALERLAREDVTAEESLALVRTPANVEFTMPPVWISDGDYSYSGMKIHRYRKATADPQDLGESSMA